ncbi:hypothetical protein CDAR_532061 [Caerostris darwini]|uniref:Uncharacterized protein n=1 Tax=Caerostris darwini TaxID=1538125 RepID=A0AAV4R541_9ARAC|nr:hypothetical protein CDAR_532061 [Caerostris darwini]
MHVTNAGAAPPNKSTSGKPRLTDTPRSQRPGSWPGGINRENKSEKSRLGLLAIHIFALKLEKDLRRGQVELTEAGAPSRTPISSGLVPGRPLCRAPRRAKRCHYFQEPGSLVSLQLPPRIVFGHPSCGVDRGRPPSIVCGFIAFALEPF